MTKYQHGKENARQKAINWQNAFAMYDYDYYDVAIITEYFVKLAKRYGLTKEFRENGII